MKNIFATTLTFARALARKKAVWIAGIGVVCVTAGVFLVHAKSNTSTTANTQAVRVAVAMNADVSDEADFTGTLEPVRDVDVAAKTGGRITNIYTDVGERVGGGQTIAELDTATEEATAQSITQSINATQNSIAALNNYYDQQISTQITPVSSTDAQSTGAQTAAVSALTNAAIVTKQADDMLGTLLSVRNGVPVNSEIGFETDLSARDAQAKITARNTLASYQGLAATYQDYFNATILNQNPSQAQVDKGVPQAVAALTSAKLVLSQTYTVLADTTTSSNVTQAQIDAYKSQVTDLGSQVQTLLQNMHDVSNTVASLQKDREAKVVAAQAQVVALQGQKAVTDTVLADGVIHAPMSGVVTAKEVEKGTVVAPGTPLIHIADDSILKLVVGVPDSKASTFHVGDAATVLVDAAGGTFSARITRIDPTVDPVSKKVTIELSIPNYDHTLKVGAYAHALFTMPHAAQIAIPRAALHSEYGALFVLVVSSSTVSQRMVTTGAESTDLVEIKSGLKLGEAVITNGNDYLRDGDMVTILNQSSL